MSGRLDGKTVVLTGASSGIGAATARHLARAGARIVLAARDRAALERVAREVEALGGEALVAPTDVRLQADCEALVAACLERWGRIDILINNAGLGYSLPVGQLIAAEVEAQLATNLLGVIWCCNAAVPLMLAQGGGAIINIGSVAGRVGVPLASVYCATKFGLDGFTQSLRSEVSRQGVAVSLLNPGFVATDFSRRASRGAADTRQRPGPEMSADEVALAIMALIRRPRRQVVMTWPYRLLTGIGRLAPGLMGWAMAQASRVIR
ncbi:MAG TPA: SDR family oxidoreductase [Herpetosiphonaceae bacterium]